MVNRLRAVARSLLVSLPGISARPLRPIFWTGLAAAGGATLLSRSPVFQPWPVLILWITGLALLLVGAGWRETPPGRAGGERAAVDAPPARWEYLAVSAITLFAFAVRALSLAAIPMNVHGDEGEMGMVARAVLSGAVRDPFSTNWADQPTLWFFIQALSLRLFGNDIAGLRMLSAILGALTIPALFFLARALFGRAVALISALLLAAYHFHLHFSRLALNTSADPLMLILTLWAFFLALRSRSRRAFALTGVLAGVAQYFYFSTRFIPVMLVMLLALFLIRERREISALHEHIGLMATGFVAAVAPLMLYFLTRPETFIDKFTSRFLFQNGGLARISTPGQSMWAALAGHAYNTLLYYLVVDEHGQFYGAGIPMLDHGMEILFLVGVAVALWNWRKLHFAALLICVFGVAFFGGFLLWQGQESQRYLMATPALCVLMAIGLVAFGSLLVRGGGFSRAISAVVVSIIVLALVVWNLQFYFQVYTPRGDYANTQAATDLAYYLQPKAANSYVYLFAAPQFYLNHGTIRFVANLPAGTDVADPLPAITALTPPVAGLRPVFVFIPDREGELGYVKQRYPVGQLNEFYARPDNSRVLLYIYEPTP